MLLKLTIIGLALAICLAAAAWRPSGETSFQEVKLRGHLANLQPVW